MRFDQGSCYGILQRYYFDIVIGQCIKFNYTGCGGNLNNFISMEECETVCIKGRFFINSGMVENFKLIINAGNQKMAEPELGPSPLKSISTENISHKTLYIKNYPALTQNATMTFVAAKIWTTNMDQIFSPERLLYWQKMEDSLNEAYGNYIFIQPNLISISKYHDGYDQFDFTQIFVQFQFYNQSFEDLKRPWMLYIQDNFQSSEIAAQILTETITIAENETANPKICRRMNIPIIPTCNDTIYGCCADGVMISTGPKSQGCPEINCPCDEMLISFVLDLNKKQIDDLENEAGKLTNFAIYNEIVDSINSTYDNQISDAYIDSRKCQASVKIKPFLKEVLIIDMAIKFKDFLDSPVEKIVKKFKSNTLGNLPLIPNSLIITGAYGKGNVQKNRRSIVTHIKSSENENTIFHLSFNEISDNIIPDVSLNGNDFELSNSHSYIKRRTLSDVNLVQKCGGIFYPKRNEIATLHVSEDSRFSATMNELTLSFWFMPLKNAPSEKKNKIISMVSENNNQESEKIEMITPVVALEGKNLSTSWGNMNCSSQLSSLETNKWTYLAIYYNLGNKSVDLYQNGRKISSCSKNDIENSLSNHKLKKIIIGDESDPVNGPIDEISMFSHKVSEETILINYEKCKNVNIFVESNGNLCNSNCPPPFKNKTKIGEREKPKIKPIGTCFQYQNRCNRNKNGLYKIVLPSQIFDNRPFSSPYRSLSTYCDMENFGGGWTLLLTNPIGSKWRPDDIFSKNINHPSTDNQFSILKFADTLLDDSENYEYMIKINFENLTSGLINSVSNRNVSFVSKIPQNDDITLVKKFGDWKYFSNTLGTRIPWIMYKLSYDGVRYPVLTTSIDQKSNEGVLLDTLDNSFKLFDSSEIFGGGIVTYWYRESNNSTYGGFIDVSGIEAEISAYYLSVEIINTENFPVIVEYYLGGSRQFLKIAEKNSTTVFTVIQSITMPISVTMKAQKQENNEDLFMNCRMELNVPIFYLKDDLYIASISKGNFGPKKDCESMYPDLNEFYYDYIIFNSLEESVVLQIQVLNISSTFHLDPKGYDDWKGSVTYLRNPDFTLSAKTLHTKKQLYINRELLWKIPPKTDKHKITKIEITESSEFVRGVSVDCSYSFDIVNDAILTLDVTWRDDILLAVIDPGERISIKFDMETTVEDLPNSKEDIQVYPHDMKLLEIVKTYINGHTREKILCDTRKIPRLFVLTTNITDLQSLKAEIKNKKITLEQKEEQICPPVIHGGYSAWSEWSQCSGSCPFDGLQYRVRFCNNPTPENGGLSCLNQGLGPDYENRSCVLDRCQNLFNSTQVLDFKIPTFGNFDKKINLILEFINSINTTLTIQIYTYNFAGTNKKYLNSSIKGLTTKNIVLNETIIQKNSAVKIIAHDQQNKRVKIGGKDELSIGYRDGFKKFTIILGNVTDINTLKYYINVRFINNVGKRVRLIFEKSHLSFNTLKFVDQESILILKTKINSMVTPGPYKVTCDSGEGTLPLFLNGQPFFALRTSTDSKDLQIVILNDHQSIFLSNLDNYHMTMKFVHLMFVNSIKDSLKIKINSIYGNDFIQIEGGKVKFYEMRIFSPIEIFLNISPMQQIYNNQSFYIDSLPNVTYVAENTENTIRLYNLAKKGI